MPSMPEDKTSQKKKKKKLPINFPGREDRLLLGLCIGVSLILWLLVKLSQTHRTEKSVVLNFNFPSDRVFVQPAPSDIAATIKGSGWSLVVEFMRNPKIDLYIDIRQFRDSIELSGGQIRSQILGAISNSAITVEELNYDNIKLYLEEQSTKRVPLNLASRLQFATGYLLMDEPKLSPDSITIMGPESLLEDIAFWNTDSLILTDIKAPVSQMVKLRLAPTGISTLQEQTRVNIVPEPYSEKSFWLPISIQGQDRKVRVFPQLIRLTCVVGLSRFDSISAEDFEIAVQIPDAAKNASGLPGHTAVLELAKKPDFVERVRFSPQSVEFFFLE